MNRKYLSVMVAALFSASVFAQKDDYSHLGKQFREFSDVEEKEWEESDSVQIPQAINDESLHRLDEISDDRFDYFLDRSTLTLGEDLVIRYIMVIRSRSGATQASYEGMRCDDKEYKVYAYKPSKGPFRAMKDPKWRRMNTSRSQAHRVYLLRDVFCDAFDVAQKPADILGLLDGRGETIRYMDKDEIR